jgi:CheY-like chemotaxis protein
MKILIAGDKDAPPIRLRAFLAKRGYEMVAAADGNEAWQKFRQLAVQVAEDLAQPHLRRI